MKPAKIFVMRSLPIDTKWQEENGCQHLLLNSVRQSLEGKEKLTSLILLEGSLQPLPELVQMYLCIEASPLLKMYR
jgi:hypothetical protein